NEVDVNGVQVPCIQFSSRAPGTLDIAVRPEDVKITPNEGALARLIQRIPRGHYQELVLAAPFGNIRAFVSNDIEPGEQVKFVFQRALVYHNGNLASEDMMVQQ